MSATIRVLLADDHALVRAGIRSLLETMTDVQVVGEAGDGNAAIEAAARLQPDAVLMDIAMKDLSGLEATQRIRAAHPAIRVIILSMHASEEYVLQAVRAGAAGYLLKSAATAELGLALRAVMDGQSYLSPPVSRHLVANYLQGGADPQRGELLTARQREVLKLLAEGQASKQIAFTLKLSVKTVEAHRAQIMERLGIREVAGLVRYAIRTGLVSPEH